MTAWTIRLALACYLGVLVAEIAGGPRRGAFRWMRLVWTAGWLLLLLHFAAAFGEFHHWSHAHAYADTAMKTERVTGIAWGGGIYFNYAMLLLWGADVACWWLAPQAVQPRPRLLTLGLHAFLFFMVFNATVVFESGPIRWAGLAASMALLVELVWVRSRGGLS